MNKVVSSILAGILLFASALPVSAQHAEHHEIEPNNTPETANRVTMQSSVIGVAQEGDVDYFKLSTPEHLATHEIQVQIYTPHPDEHTGLLPCAVTVSIRNPYPQITYTTERTDYRLRWTAKHSLYYIGIQSTCDDLHYQIDFSRVRGPYRTYLPFVAW